LKSVAESITAERCVAGALRSIAIDTALYEQTWHQQQPQA